MEGGVRHVHISCYCDGYVRGDGTVVTIWPCADGSTITARLTTPRSTTGHGDRVGLHDEVHKNPQRLYVGLGEN